MPGCGLATRRRTVSLVGHLLSLILLIALPAGATTPEAPPPAASDEATYVGGSQCSSCHADQAARWQQSHHAQAMQEANEKTVLGNFDNATFDYFGVQSSFYKKEGRFYVRTEGPDGVLTEYAVAYTFGIYPLQQYLVPFPDGRLQALSIAWDTRAVDQGGQRWFHLYPDEAIKAGDELHWTGPNQNWNYMCADCHSTDVDKNFEPEKNQYATRWTDINVSCESCHGPGSRHLRWAQSGDPASPDKGLTVPLNERKNVHWTLNPQTGNSTRSEPRSTEREIETCAFCHARRVTGFQHARPGQSVMDNLQIALLTDPLYYADGQINDEVFEYGSFVQSKMYHAGVTCSDCHQPHSLSLRAEGNALCAQCHLPDKYDRPDHHQHASGSEGAQCVNCHMPTKTYMVVDPRHDHSIRIPRPDLSVSLQTPNACNQCHTDQSAEWAAKHLKSKFGPPGPHYGEALYAGRQGLSDAINRLATLTMDNEKPAIVRATAVSQLTAYLSQDTAPILQMAANDPQPLVGYGLANGLMALPAQPRLPIAYPLLFDDSRITRSLTARALAGVSEAGMPAEGKPRFDQALKDYTASQHFNSDRAEGLSNLAALSVQQGDLKSAIANYRKAIAKAPFYTPAYINLADVYRQNGEETQARAVLEEALKALRDTTPAHHALGLLFVREKKMPEALEHLRLAAESPTANEHYLYVYGVALNSSGKREEALHVLESANTRFPGNPDILYALVSIHRAAGNVQQAQTYENSLNTPQ